MQVDRCQSANPRQLKLACGITVNLPRWLDMDPDSNSNDGCHFVST